MKILFVSIHFGPPFQRDLMKALAARGHEICFYSAGLTNFSNRIALRWRKRGGIAEAQLLNSPVVPASSMDPAVQSEAAGVDAITQEVLDRFQPDVVHVHELSGHGLSLVDSLRGRSIPYVMSVHNFWALCPQMNLIDAGGETCRDFEGGARCMSCRWLPDAGSRTGVDRARSALAATPLFKPSRRMRQAARRLIAGRAASADAAGWSAPRYSAGAFARRRERAVEAFKGAGAIHAMSSSTADVLAAHGVPRERIRVLPISLFSLDRLETAASKPVTQPITFGYRGALSYIKGVHHLVAAFSKLDQTKARLLIYGSGEPSYELGLRAIARGLNVEFRGEYRPEQLAAINAGIDVGVVPSICNETFCLTGIEFLRSGVPVIATRLGGMADYVRESVNGILVPPGDVDALATVMQRLVDAPEQIEALGVPLPTPSMNDVTQSMIDLYQEAIASV